MCQPTAAFYFVLVVESFYLAGWMVQVLAAIFLLASYTRMRLMLEHYMGHNSASERYYAASASASVASAESGVGSVFVIVSLVTLVFFLAQLAAVICLGVGHFKRKWAPMVYYLVWNGIFHLFLTPMWMIGCFVIISSQLSSENKDLKKSLYGILIPSFVVTLALSIYRFYVILKCINQYKHEQRTTVDNEACGLVVLENYTPEDGKYHRF